MIEPCKDSRDQSIRARRLVIQNGVSHERDGALAGNRVYELDVGHILINRIHVSGERDRQGEIMAELRERRMSGVCVCAAKRLRAMIAVDREAHFSREAEAHLSAPCRKRASWRVMNGSFGLRPSARDSNRAASAQFPAAN